MEALQTSTMDKLTTLIKDKGAVKKNYADNRERIDNQLLKVFYASLKMNCIRLRHNSRAF